MLRAGIGRAAIPAMETSIVDDAQAGGSAPPNSPAASEVGE
jgi:hypothetical protein